MPVIPAKAGTQPCHSTKIGIVARLGSRFRGNDGAKWTAMGKIGGARKLHRIAQGTVLSYMRILGSSLLGVSGNYLLLAA